MLGGRNLFILYYDLTNKNICSIMESERVFVEDYFIGNRSIMNIIQKEEFYFETEEVCWKMERWQTSSAFAFDFSDQLFVHWLQINQAGRRV